MAKGIKTGGRPAGTPNKATANAREAIASFVDKNASRLEDLLAKIEAQDGPAAAYRCIMDLMEYHVPKLARTEHTGKDGAAIATVVKHEYYDRAPSLEAAQPAVQHRYDE